MFGSATKFNLGASGLFALAALYMGIASGADTTTDVAFLATAVLGTAAAVFLWFAVVSFAGADPVSFDRSREHIYLTSPAYWPPMAAAGVGIITVGLVVNTQLTLLGAAILILAALEWTLSAWADRRTPDMSRNLEERARLALPIQVPVYGALAIAVPVFMLSRILLSVERNVASITAIVVAAAVLAFAFLVYLVPSVRDNIMVIVVALAVAALIGGGIVAAAVGERDIGHEGSGESAPAHQPVAVGTAQTAMVTVVRQ